MTQNLDLDKGKELIQKLKLDVEELKLNAIKYLNENNPNLESLTSNLLEISEHIKKYNTQLNELNSSKKELSYITSEFFEVQKKYNSEIQNLKTCYSNLEGLDLKRSQLEERIKNYDFYDFSLMTPTIEYLIAKLNEVNHVGQELEKSFNKDNSVNALTGFFSKLYNTLIIQAKMITDLKQMNISNKSVEKYCTEVVPSALKYLMEILINEFGNNSKEKGLSAIISQNNETIADKKSLNNDSNTLNSSGFEPYFQKAKDSIIYASICNKSSSIRAIKNLMPEKYHTLLLIGLKKDSLYNCSDLRMIKYEGDVWSEKKKLIKSNVKIIDKVTGLIKQGNNKYRNLNSCLDEEEKNKFNIVCEICPDLFIRGKAKISLSENYEKILNELIGEE
ncbi:MAG: hypothetical protein WC393_05725 [Candidatus Nanoarchaeia archaeon]|jgi:hypothetical protein